MSKKKPFDDLHFLITLNLDGELIKVEYNSESGLMAIEGARYPRHYKTVMSFCQPIFDTYRDLLKGSS